MQDFQKVYLHMFYEQAGKIKFDLNIYETFLKNAIKFNNQGLIKEDKSLLIDVPDETIIYLLKNNETEYLSGSQFINTFKNSRHWRNIKNIKIEEIFFMIFDFTNDKEIDSFNYKVFQIQDDNTLNIARDMFKSYVYSLNGFYNIINELPIICVNKQTDNIQNVLTHEISHFLQTHCNIKIIKSKILEKETSKLNNIFGAEIDKCLSYFSQNEFIPSLDDLLLSLKKVKNKFYSKLTALEFLMEIKSYLKTVYQTKNINHEFFYKFGEVNSYDYYSLTFLITSWILNYRYQYIEHKILKYFQLNGD